MAKKTVASASKLSTNPSPSPKPPAKQPRMAAYKERANEPREVAGMEILYEVLAEDSENGESEDLPCRTLDNFVVFDQLNSNVVVSLEDIGDDGTDITIAGDVAALDASELDDITEEPDDADDDGDDEGESSLERHRKEGSQPLCLSAILYYEVHLTQRGESEIWVRTCYAWYKLLNPHPGYAYMYAPLYKVVYIAHQAVLRAAESPDLTIAKFTRDVLQGTSDILSHLPPISMNEFNKNRDMIADEVNVCCGALDRDHLLDTPFLQALCRGPAKNKHKQHAPAANRGRSTVQSKTIGEPKKENPACITQLVADIARGLYAEHLMNVTNYQTGDPSKQQQEVGTDAESASNSGGKAWEKKYSSRKKTVRAELKRSLDDKGKLLVEELRAHDVAMKTFRVNTVWWPQEFRLPAPMSGWRYASEVHVDAMIQGADGSRTSGMVPIKIGDVVLVKASGPKTGFTIDPIWEGFQPETSHAQGVYVKAVVVESIYSKILGNLQMIHGRTLLPGRDTILGEVAAPHEWFLADQCASYSIDTHLHGKMSVSFIPTNVDVETEVFAKKNTMFCRFWYDLSQGMFEDVNLHKAASTSPIRMWCPLCKSKRNAVVRVAKQIVPGTKTVEKGGKQHVISEFVLSTVVEGVTYHEHDAVYMRSHTPNHPFEIGYIKSIKSYGDLEPQITVVILRRMRDVAPVLQPVGSDPSYVDDRHLFWTPKE
ncbi:hypothetical protein FBU59_001898, partial [Linderina macrospora]